MSLKPTYEGPGYAEPNRPEDEPKIYIEREDVITASQGVYNFAIGDALNTCISDALSGSCGSEVLMSLPWGKAGKLGNLVSDGAAASKVASTPSISNGKLDYLFGMVDSNSHNAARSKSMRRQFGRIGVHNNEQGRRLVTDHLAEVARDKTNISQTFSNKYGTFVVKESIFSGPGGFLKFESTWQVGDSGLRFITVIPRG